MPFQRHQALWVVIDAPERRIAAAENKVYTLENQQQDSQDPAAVPQQQRILIVDDYEDHRVILRYQLRKIGNFDIREVPDGQQALDLAARESLHLIFMNLGLPVLDGWEATRRIRALPGPRRNVPIIAFTAYTWPNAEQRARDAGCDEYLTKPLVSRALLEQQVTRLLTQGRKP